VGSLRTPANISRGHRQLNKEINSALNDPKMKARFADLGGEVLPGSPADFGRLVRSDTEKWAQLIRAVNIKLQ